MLDHLTAENLRLLEARDRFRDDLHLDPGRHFPFLRPCTVKLLLVTDGGLDFSEGGFGLSTFVRTLLDMPGRHARFDITLAHINNVADSQLLPSEPRIGTRIKAFRFDNGSHFSVDKYDAVFLFGIATPSNGRELANAELRVLTQFMNAGGGLFATGDHGALGKALCHAIPRARGMRLWDSKPAASPQDLDTVSMGGMRRNDTNRPQAGGSFFNDQCDDVPQRVQPRMYGRTVGLFRYRYPHPLLCGPRGMIRVMPDHPHEGECVEPVSTGANLDFGGALGPEYPAATDGGPRPLPELVSHSTVLAGTTSGKAATLAQTFGGICAYDGHRAGVGRVVTDATWHHFVNVNLVGTAGGGGQPAGHPWHNGFLSSAAGQAHLEDIKAYYRNLAVWLSRPERIRCMNGRLLWVLVWDERVMEAVLTRPDIGLAALDLPTIRLIGIHARDVLGRLASRCQTVRLVLDLVYPEIPRLIPEIDPWWPLPDPLPRDPDEFDWLDASPLLDIAVGSALVAVREAFPEPTMKNAARLDGGKIEKVLQAGAAVGVNRAIKSLAASPRAAEGLLEQIASKPAARKPTRKPAATRPTAGRKRS